MKKEDKKLTDNIPESIFNIVKETQESANRVSESIKKIMPKFPKINLPEIPSFNIPSIDELELGPTHEVTKEQNNWERHKEILDVENAVLKIQNKILEEQKSTTKLTKWILSLTILGIIVTAVFSFIK